MRLLLFFVIVKRWRLCGCDASKTRHWSSPARIITTIPSLINKRHKCWWMFWSWHETRGRWWVGYYLNVLKRLRLGWASFVSNLGCESSSSAYKVRCGWCLHELRTSLMSSVSRLRSQSSLLILTYCYVFRPWYQMSFDPDVLPPSYHI